MAKTYDLFTEARLKKGWSLDDVARHMRMTRQAINQYKINGIPENNLYTVCKILDIEPADMEEAVIEDFRDGIRRKLKGER